MNDAFWQPGWVLPEGFSYVVNELCGERAELANEELANELMASELRGGGQVASKLRAGKRAQSWQASSELANKLRAGEQALRWQTSPEVVNRRNCVLVKKPE